MKEYKLTQTEAKFADIIWSHEPITSPDLVILCEERLNWKKSTTYTVLKKLCEKKIFKNEKTIVTSILKKEEFYGRQSQKYIEEIFGGSLPRFLTAFMGGKKLSKKQIEEIQVFIDKYKGEE